MPIFNKADLEGLARKYGFQRDTFEKVLRIKAILEFFEEDKLLKEHLILKGGTAINLAVFSLPRLSVDIDMDYMPNDSREDMLATRGQLFSIIKDYMESEGYYLSESSRFSHSLDAFYFQYQNAGGNKDMLKIELNYSLRAHVLEPVYREITTDAFGTRIQIHIVHPIEIFAAKANALISRAAARDLYDFHNLITLRPFPEIEEMELFRKTIIFYATISAETVNRSFDTSAIDSLTFPKIRRDLFPVLTRNETGKHFDLDLYKNQVKDYLHTLMVVSPEEDEYMDRFISGEYIPALLFGSSYSIVKHIENHPMAIWKCQRNR